MRKESALQLAVSILAVVGLTAWSSMGEESPTPLGPEAVVVSAPTADGGCRHTIKVTNTGSRTVRIKWYDSKVRTRLGTWKQLYGGGFGIFYQAPDPSDFPVRPGTEHSWIYTTDFGCNARRRWRFRLTRSDGLEDMLYIPSSTSFTTSQTINLGDLGRSSLF